MMRFGAKTFISYGTPVFNYVNLEESHLDYESGYYYRRNCRRHWGRSLLREHVVRPFVHIIINLRRLHPTNIGHR